MFPNELIKKMIMEILEKNVQQQKNPKKIMKKSMKMKKMRVKFMNLEAKKQPKRIKTEMTPTNRTMMKIDNLDNIVKLVPQKAKIYQLKKEVELTQEKVLPARKVNQHRITKKKKIMNNLIVKLMRNHPKNLKNCCK